MNKKYKLNGILSSLVNKKIVYEEYDNYIIEKYTNWKIDYKLNEKIDNHLLYLKEMMKTNLYYRYGLDDEELEYSNYVEEYIELLEIRNKYKNIYYEYDLDLEDFNYNLSIYNEYIEYLSL